MNKTIIVLAVGAGVLFLITNLKDNKKNTTEIKTKKKLPFVEYKGGKAIVVPPLTEKGSAEEATRGRG